MLAGTPRPRISRGRGMCISGVRTLEYIFQKWFCDVLNRRIPLNSPILPYGYLFSTNRHYFSGSVGFYDNRFAVLYFEIYHGNRLILGLYGRNVTKVLFSRFFCCILKVLYKTCYEVLVVRSYAMTSTLNRCS